MSKRRNITLVSKKTVIKLGKAFVIEPGKKYIISLPDFDESDAHDVLNAIIKMGADSTSIALNSDNMKITEVQ